MLIGYARVSTLEQNLDLQMDALKKAGCEKIFTDKMSGARDDRQGFQEALEFLRTGDVLVAWHLDRIGRSTIDLIKIVNSLAERDIGIKTLQGQVIDTTTSHGKLMFHIFAALTEYERNRILERTHAGLAAARARGRLGGRPKALDTKKQQIAKTLYQDKSNSVKQICETLKISRSTLYKYLEESKHTA